MTSGAANNPWVQIGAPADSVQADTPAPATLTQEQVRSFIGGATQARQVGATAIDLPAHKEALWWKMQEGSGLVLTDEVLGLQLDVLGTVTNQWDTAGWMTLNADTRAALYNNTYITKFFDLVPFLVTGGSLIAGFEIWVPDTGLSGTCFPWGVGNNGSNTTGGWGSRVSDSGSGSLLSLCGYTAVGGTTFRTSKNLTTEVLTGRNRRTVHLVIHAFDGKAWIEGYDEGVHSRTARLFDMDGAALPSPVANYGLRVGARPGNAVGGGSNYLGAGATGVRMRNMHFLRVTGDYRSQIPAWIANMAATIPYGVIPGAFNG